jgi:hypothetical protein
VRRRALAVAERLWSPRQLTSVEAASARYHFMRCVLDRRAVGVGINLIVTIEKQILNIIGNLV